MAISVTINIDQFRGDSGILPAITVSGETLGWVKIADWVYHLVNNGTSIIIPPNRSLNPCPVVVRNVVDPTWVLGTNITETGSGIQRTSGVGFDGAYYDTALSEEKCGIQAKTTSFNPCGISLQDQTGISHDYEAVDAVQHAIIFDHDGQGRILENGNTPPVNRYFQYEIGDIGMIELIDGIVRYYLIKPDWEMTLLRTTRSKLTEAPKAEVMIYQSDAALDDCFVFNNDEDSVSFENIAVLNNFQDWMNDFAWVSTSNPIQMADNNVQFTFPNHKQQLRVLNANLAMRTKTERDAFLAFYRHHGMEIPFIFVDKAHRDENNNNTEFWAQFISPFSDKTRSSCLTTHQAQITEAYRNDYIPVLIDSTPPATPSITDITDLGDGLYSITHTLVADNVVAYEYRLGIFGIEGTTWNDPITRTEYWIDTFEVSAPGNNFIEVRALDASGQYSNWSTTGVLVEP